MTALPRTRLLPPADQLAEGLRSETMRLLGYKEGRTRVEGRHLELVDQGILLAREVSRPAASLAYCAVTVTGDQVSTAIPGLVWRSRSLARLLKGGVAVSLVAATLGPEIDEQIQRLFAREEYALATIVDAAGSALVHGLARYLREQLGDQLRDRLGDRLGDQLREQLGDQLRDQLRDRLGDRLGDQLMEKLGAQEQGGRVELTPLYGPGYGDWPIQDQIGLTEAAGGPTVGLTCTDACYLTPQKSLVGLIGWVERERPGNQRSGNQRLVDERPGAERRVGQRRGDQRLGNDRRDGQRRGDQRLGNDRRDGQRRGSTPAAGCALCTMPDCAYRVKPERGGRE